MTVERRSGTERLAQIRALRERLAELETAAGIGAPPAASGDEPENARRGLSVLRGLMETLLIGFAVGDSEGRILDANEAFASLLGYHRPELLGAGLNWKEITPPEYAERDLAAVEAMRRTGTSGSYVKEYFRRDGSRVRVVLAGVQSATDRDEHAVFVLDDSDRSSAERSAERTERLYQQILDAVPDLLVLRNHDARILWANRAALDFFGRDAASVAGSFSLDGVTCPALLGELRDHDVVVETGMAVDLPRESLQRADGERRIFHTVRSPVTDADGRVIRAVSVARDVTDRARAQQSLQRSETNLRTAQALAHVGSFEIRVPYTGDAYWSDEVYHILGLPPTKETIAPDAFIERFIRADHAQLVGSAMDALIREERPFELRYPIVRPSGEERWVRGLGAPLRDASGAVVGIVGALVDLTDETKAEADRERIEARLQRAKELEAVGTLARGVAHDFNNILGALAGYAELALEQAGEGTELRSDVEQILRAAGRASDLVASLLALGGQPAGGPAGVQPGDSVREDGGTMPIESAPGEEAPVRAYLPRQVPARERGAAAPCEIARGSGERVLLVDDERALAELGRRRLEELGYRPTVFSDAQRALEAFRQRPGEFDLLVTDQIMPHLTGVDLAREVHRIRPDLAVLLVSAYGDAARAEALATAGIRSVLGKPASPEAFASAVRDALSKRSA